MAVNRIYAQNNKTMPNLDFTGQNKAGSAVKSGDPVVVGSIPGVAAIDADATGAGIMFTDGIFNLSVKGETSGGNGALAEGAIVYFDSAKAALNGDNTKVRFGYLLKGVASGATATVPVQVGY